VSSTVIVIPTHNGLTQLQACIAGLDWARPRADVRVLVVDSGSTDGTLSWLRGQTPWVDCMEGPDAWWWTQAVESGLRYAAATWNPSRMALTNDDALWDEEGFDAVSEVLDNHPDDMTCSVILFADTGRLMYGGGQVDWTGRISIPDYRGSPPPRDGVEARTAWCGGMGVMFASDTWRAMGGYDYDAFPHYYGDADFCLRLGASGRCLWLCPGSVVVNDKNTTGLGIPTRGARVSDVLLVLTSRRSVWNVRDTTRFYARHARSRAPLALAHLYGLVLASSAKRLLLSRIRRERPE
jgi:GT2 family glycosyltransferase